MRDRCESARVAVAAAAAAAEDYEALQPISQSVICCTHRFLFDYLSSSSPRSVGLCRARLGARDVMRRRLDSRNGTRPFDRNKTTTGFIRPLPAPSLSHSLSLADSAGLVPFLVFLSFRRDNETFTSSSPAHQSPIRRNFWTRRLTLTGRPAGGLLDSHWFHQPALHPADPAGRVARPPRWVSGRCVRTTSDYRRD